MSDTLVSDSVLHVERLIAAPPDRVFAHWVEPALLVKWWGPEGANIPEHAIDVRPGGQWRTTMGFADGKRMTVSGVYRTIDAPKRLVFTWAWEDEKGVRGHETEVTVDFAAAPGGTRISITQQAFTSAESRDQHQRGWNSTLNCLDKLLSGGK
jgi:uncharacterized protein YndB with AHSA1/START domain